MARRPGAVEGRVCAGLTPAGAGCAGGRTLDAPVPQPVGRPASSPPAPSSPSCCWAGWSCWCRGTGRGAGRSSRPNARRCRRRTRRSRARRTWPAPPWRCATCSCPRRPRRWTRLAAAMQREVGLARRPAAGRRRARRRPGGGRTLDLARPAARPDYARLDRRAGALPAGADRAARHRLLPPRRRIRPGLRGGLQHGRDRRARGAAGGGAAAADDLPPGGGRCPRWAASVTLPPATRARRAGSAGLRRSCGCMRGRWPGWPPAGRARPT